MWETRALELNNQDIWNWSSVCNLVRYASQHGFNTIVVGQACLQNEQTITRAKFALPANVGWWYYRRYSYK